MKAGVSLGAISGVHAQQPAQALDGFAPIGTKFSGSAVYSLPNGCRLRYCKGVRLRDDILPHHEKKYGPRWYKYPFYINEGLQRRPAPVVALEAEPTIARPFARETGDVFSEVSRHPRLREVRQIILVEVLDWFAASAAFG